MGAAYMDQQVNIQAETRKAFYSLFSGMVPAPILT